MTTRMNRTLCALMAATALVAGVAGCATPVVLGGVALGGQLVDLLRVFLAEIIRPEIMRHFMRQRADGFLARAMARSIDAGDEEQVRWLSYAAPTVVSRCATKVGHDAIQLHGGMGVTDELIISHYNSRLVVLQQLLARWVGDAQSSSSSTI